MAPTSLEEFKKQLIEEITTPYIQEINRLKNQVQVMEKKVQELESQLKKKEEYIAELEAKLEQISGERGIRLSKPVRNDRYEDEVDPVLFILGR